MDSNYFHVYGGLLERLAMEVRVRGSFVKVLVSLNVLRLGNSRMIMFLVKLMNLFKIALS